MSGCIPPPSVDFSFIGVDKRRAVVFGGYQPPSGITNDTFLLDMDAWVSVCTVYMYILYMSFYEH